MPADTLDDSLRRRSATRLHLLAIPGCDPVEAETPASLLEHDRCERRFRDAVRSSPGVAGPDSDWSFSNVVPRSYSVPVTEQEVFDDDGELR